MCIARLSSYLVDLKRYGNRPQTNDLILRRIGSTVGQALGKTDTACFSKSGGAASGTEKL